jgi:hypothetical protein
MQMKLFTVILTFQLLVTVGFSRAADPPGKEKKYPTCYKEGIVVNGNSQEWENSLFSFNKQAQANYAIVNDTAAFYICIRIADDAAQMKVIRNGIEVRFNSKGKKKAEATLHFPIGGRPEVTGRLDPGNRSDRKTMHLMFLLQMQDMELSGFKSGVDGFQNIKSGKNGIVATVNWDSANVMVYEARIPFNVFVADVRAVEPLAVGIIIRGAVKPKNSEGKQDIGQDMQSGHGQDRAGGMHPGGGRGMEGSMQDLGDIQKMFEDDEIWRMIAVAKKE